MEGKAYKHFVFRLWRNVARELECNPADLDIPQHYELWQFWGDLKSSTGKDGKALKAFVHLAKCIAVFATSSADCERVFSVFKRKIDMEGGQGNASPQLQAAVVMRCCNVDRDPKEVLEGYKRSITQAGVQYGRARQPPVNPN